jgi:MFS family permease
LWPGGCCVLSSVLCCGEVRGPAKGPVIPATACWVLSKETNRSVPLRTASPPAHCLPARLPTTACPACRAMMGVGEGVTYPSIQNLARKWVPEAKRSRALAFIYSGACLAGWWVPGCLVGGWVGGLVAFSNWCSVLQSWCQTSRWVGALWVGAWWVGGWWLMLCFAQCSAPLSHD